MSLDSPEDPPLDASEDSSEGSSDDSLEDSPRDVSGRSSEGAPAGDAPAEDAPAEDAPARLFAFQPAPEDGGQEFPVVGIGASAGGVGALRRFFRNLPDEVGMAFVVVLHLSPDHESNLTEILQHETDLPVQVATDECPLEADHIYVIPPQHEIQVEASMLRLSDRSSDHRPDTIDALLGSLAAAYKRQAIGIILSGTGADGTLGLRSIKSHGGIAMVQQPGDAEHEDMPRSALDTGVIDLVAPADELAERLVAYHENARTIQLPESEEELPADEQTTLQKIFTELQGRTGHDFSHYKRSTVLRRLERRLQVTDVETLSAYLQVLNDQPGEARALYKELLISVTRFFRTPEAFETLEDSVIPSLFEDKAPDEEVRVWVSGCATGEEAYSLAILLHEYARALEAPPSIQVFATDVDTEGLATARAGVYPPTIAADVSEARLDRFFRRENDQYRVTPSLRNSVVFAEHDLTQDPPFSNLDLVCCRNLLIYLDQTLQEYVFRLFHYALNENGFLFLGPSEAIGPAQSFFAVVDETRSILKVKSPASDEDRPVPLFPPSNTSSPDPTPQTPTRTPSDDMETVHQRLLMDQMASLLVNENREIVHLTGEAGQFLRHKPGTPTHNLLEKVPPTLRLELRGALYQAFQKDQTTERTLPFPAPEGPEHVRVRVQPVDSPNVDRRLAQVCFENVERVDLDGMEGDAPDTSPSTEVTERERDLEDELQDIKEQLQITSEEYETVTEEMETANEELMSMNEELQAKNEELQTSKEQLQSVNEELTTTNQQLSAKVEALDQANNDLQNLMETTEVATLFLGRDLEIRRYTPPVTEVFSLRESDIGRPITDFTPKIRYDALVEDAERVLAEQTAIEHEVEGPGRTWYLMRLRPYRTMVDEVEGVVVTFVDITAQKHAARTLRAERDLVSALIDTAGALIVVLGEDGAIVRFNTACERLTGYDAAEAEGTDLRDLLVAPDDRDAVTARLDALADGTIDRADLEMRWTPAEGDPRLIKGSFTALRDESGDVKHFIVTGTDMTRHRELEREVIEVSNRERQRIGEALHDVVSSGLTNAAMRAETLAYDLREKSDLKEKSEEGPEEDLEQEATVEAEDLQKIFSKVKEAGDQIRSLSHALIPRALRQDHLAAALADLADEEEDFSDVECVFVGDETETRPEDETDAMNLYRIAHEAVANAREHADPSRIQLGLREEGSGLVLSIRDDGRGWDGETPDDEGLGLHLMRYRANLIGATLTLSSGDGQTVVECRLPLP
ncbi:protein-glutamate methylesterase CheB (plasmid) [Salinibacter ruber M8]|uniref:protein-glutamate O-methyltransferase n=1 Tax=Salinibacter ruber (strain M8) TaxID=761659 RepID=D6CVZ6_SALRM|nr:chemotaxis protein CheB [Salinibacter ruber]CBH22825.1 protein-glutamate methylesterase CheB [Salinibacter ruber M8]